MEFKALKKAAAIFMCAAIAGMSVVTAFAADKTYSVPEAADMQITLPDDMTAVTRSSDANDQYFSLFGIDYNTNKQNFESSDIYLQGMNSSSSLTVTVTVTETDESKQITNYNLLESDRISEIARNFLSQNEYTSCTVDQAVSKIVWLNFNTRVNYSGSLIEAYQANTVYNGKSINVTLQRNGGNVTAEDYQTFTKIVSSVEFNKIGFLSSPVLPFIIIGAVVLLILIIVFIIIIVRVAKRRRKKNKNDKILEELAGKYTSGKQNNGASYSYDSDSLDDISEAPASDKTMVYDVVSLEKHSESEDYSGADSDGARRYSDDEIDAMLGDTDEGEQSNFIQALPKSEEEPEETEDDTINKSEAVSEFFEDEPSDEETKAVPETKKFAFPVKTVEQAGETEPEEAQPEENGAVSAEEATEPEQSEPEQSEPETEDGGKNEDGTLKDYIKSALREFDSDYDEYEEYTNDEVLVREEAKHAKFADSDDYFEEAPKKVMGVISSKEIQDAEEYDVIGEMERRADEVEKEPAARGERATEALKKAGGGVKSFFVHCGYFSTNLRRDIKHKREVKKRKQYEEDRKRRARERAERQRMQEQNGELVQVHKRTDRKPSNQSRPSSNQRRPSSSQNRKSNHPRKR